MGMLPIAYARWLQVAGRASKQKGSRNERAFADAIGGKRVPLSGAHPDLPGDVTGLGLIWQCKVRGDGFRQLYSWLEGHDALAVRSDRHGWLVVLPLATYLKQLGIAEGESA